VRRALLVLALALAACRTAPATRPPSDVTVGATKGGSGISPTPCSEDAGETATDTDAYGRKISVICIEGVRGDARKTIETALGFQAGAVLTEKVLREALESIHRTQIVDDATAYARKLGPGVILTFRLHERPRVKKVVVEGNSTVNIDVQQAPERTALHPGEHYDPAYAFERAHVLREAYLTAGYEDATVTPETKPAGDGLIDVHMVIHEGIRSRIGAVTTKGATPALEAGLLKASGLVRGEPIAPEVLSDAPVRMSAFYYESGHITAKVNVERGTRAADGSVPLTIDVTEGPVFKVGKIQLAKSDLDAAATHRLLASLRTKSGDVFRRSVVAADIEAVKHAFSDRGRIVDVQPATDVNPTKHTIDIAFEISGQ
jgi:outer membrane protein insertion porin family